MSMHGSTIAAASRTTAGLGQGLVGEIPQEQFAVMPHAGMNHPAFILGHLGFYADRALHLLDRDDLADPREDGETLFAMGVECVEQEGLYPTRDELLAWFTARHEAGAVALETCDDAILARPNEGGPLPERLPTIGAAITFMYVAHPMMHIGQLSAWRRAMGMGRLF